MDFYDHANTQPSHYEYSAQASQQEISERVKQKAYDAMNQLEGWCSYQKAAILIDFILKIKPQVILEIGVFGGKSLVPMAIAVKENGSGKVYGIDPWDCGASVEGMDKPNKEWWGSLDHDANLNHLK